MRSAIAGHCGFIVDVVTAFPPVWATAIPMANVEAYKTGAARDGITRVLACEEPRSRNELLCSDSVYRSQSQPYEMKSALGSNLRSGRIRPAELHQ